MCNKGEKKSKFEVCNFGAWAMNVVSSVGIIMANKELMSPQGFAFAFGQFPSSSSSFASSSYA